MTESRRAGVIGAWRKKCLVLICFWMFVMNWDVDAAPDKQEAAGFSPDGYDFTLIDQYALATPESATKSLNHLARHLTSGARNDLEKTRAIYRWITDNVKYDMVAYNSGKLRSTNLNADDVLRTRLTICDGYSRLFEELSYLSGLAVVRVEGYVESLGRYGSNPLRYGGWPNHAWNAVRFEGKWYLIDATWGVGGGFEDYFLPLPSRLIRTHFPADPKWQLLKPHLTIRQYQDQVLKDKAFIRNQ